MTTFSGHLQKSPPAVTALPRRSLFAVAQVPPVVSGPDFIAESVRDWLEQSGCGKIFITPGSPWANPYIESFIGKLKDECLNCELFANLTEARVVIEEWRCEYNTERPHSSLGYLTPAQYAAQQAEGEVSGPRCVGSGRAKPSLRPHSGTPTASLSL